MPIPRVIPQPEAAYYLKQGFDQLADLLAITLGPTRGAVLSDSHKSKAPTMLNDAATIARRFVALPDRRQDVGAMMLRQLVWRMHKEVGDGGATTAVLAQAILHEGSKMVAAGANTVLVQHGIKQASQTAVSALQQLAHPIARQEQLAAVAQAVTSHPDLAWILGEMVYLLGRHAHITIENYVAPYLERVYLEGGHWGGQLISPYLVTAPTSQRAIQQDCVVALYDGRLHDAEAIKPLLHLVAEQEPPTLLLVGSDIGGEALNLLVGTHQLPQNKLKIVAVSLRIGGAQGLVELSDLALLTGATVLGDVVGRPLNTVTTTDLGHVKRAEADKNGLFVVQTQSRGSVIRHEITALQTQLDALDPDDEEGRGTLQKRLARLSGSAGVLKVGALTKPARDVLHQNAEQGIKAVAAALEEGVLPGGGVAFARAAQQIDLDSASSDDERMGMLAVKRALEAPFHRLLSNAGVEATAVYLHDILATNDTHLVYDILSHSLRPAAEAGVLDAAKVMRRALETAASSAEMALSVDVTILKRRPVTNVDYEP